MAKRYTLQEAYAKFGDVSLSEAIKLMSRPSRPGAPLKWTGRKLEDVLLGVEALKATGLGITAARRAYARYSGRTPKHVEKRYAEAKLKCSWLMYLLRDDPKYVNEHVIPEYLKEFPAFRKFLKRLPSLVGS